MVLRGWLANDQILSSPFFSFHFLFFFRCREAVGLVLYRYIKASVESERETLEK